MTLFQVRATWFLSNLEFRNFGCLASKNEADENVNIACLQHSGGRERVSRLKM